ncbi:hypothetical protein Hanom_Chr05g00460491 [Helianthus anomalus]
MTHENYRLAGQSYAINGSVMLPAPNKPIHQTVPLSRPPMGRPGEQVEGVMCHDCLSVR